LIWGVAFNVAKSQFELRRNLHIALIGLVGFEHAKCTVQRQ